MQDGEPRDPTLWLREERAAYRARILAALDENRALQREILAHQDGEPFDVNAEIDALRGGSEADQQDRPAPREAPRSGGTVHESYRAGLRASLERLRAVHAEVVARRDGEPIAVEAELAALRGYGSDAPAS